MKNESRLLAGFFLWVTPCFVNAVKFFVPSVVNKKNTENTEKVTDKKSRQLAGYLF